MSNPSPPHSPQPQYSPPNSPQNPNFFPDPNPIPQTLTLDSQTEPDPDDQNRGLTEDQPDPQAIDDDEEPEDLELEPIAKTATMVIAGKRPAAPFRRAQKRKKGSFKGRSRAKLASNEKKLSALVKSLNPIVFVPEKILDFGRFEELLKRVGLWDFAHVEFDKDVRGDLVAQLIVSYSNVTRGGYVNECKILVNRAALARALCLPVKKAGDFGVEKWPEEFLVFLDEFVSNWMLLHEDTWVLPDEILNWMRLIKEGSLEKVDWAGVMWFMMEKELGQGQHLLNCYYASHFQLLIKTQKEELLKSSPPVGDEDNSGDVKMVECEEISAMPESHEQVTELILGQMGSIDPKNSDVVHDLEKGCDINNVKDADDADKQEDIDRVDTEIDDANAVKMEDIVDDSNCDDGGGDDNDDANKEEMGGETMVFDGFLGKERGEFLFDGENTVRGSTLQRCSMADAKVNNEDQGQHGVFSDVYGDHELEEHKQVEDFSSMQRQDCLDEMSSENLIRGMESIPLPFTSEICLPQSTMQPPSRMADHNLMLGESSVFPKAVKREMDHDHGTSNHAMNQDQKRATVDGYWGHDQEDFETCMDQVQQWNQKAIIAFQTFKDTSRQQANMREHYLASELAEKENMYHQLNCKYVALQHTRQAEITRYENELSVMSRLIYGYRKALKETQQAFADYRKKCPQFDEPIYKDAGAGGVVKSVTELEMERLKLEEEERMMRNMARDMVTCFEVAWQSKFNGFLEDIEMFSRRFSDLKEKVDLLKEFSAKGKAEAPVSKA